MRRESNMYDIKNVSDKLVAMLEEKGVSLYECTVSESEKRELNTEGADFNLLRTIFGCGVSVTVILEGKKGSASGNDLSDAGLEKVVSDALLSAQSSLQDEANVIAEKQDSEVFRAGLFSADMPRFYDCLKSMIDAIGRTIRRSTSCRSSPITPMNISCIATPTAPASSSLTALIT